MFFNKKEDTGRLSAFLDNHQLKEVRRLIRQKKAGLFTAVAKTSLCEQVAYPELNPLVQDRNLISYVQDINDIITSRAYEELFYKLALNAEDAATALIGRGLGFGDEIEAIKKAVLCQLISKEQIHILVLTDDPPFREMLIENTRLLSPIVCVYEGGRKNLVVERKGRILNKGILQKVNNGMFIASEFRAEKEGNQVITAMESGISSYERKAVSAKYDTKVNVLAFASPHGMRLITSSLSVLRRQVPFDEATLSGFHIIFVIPHRARKAEVHKIIEEDIDVMKRFITFCKEHPVPWDDRYNSLIEKFFSLIKEDEVHFVADVTEKTKEGIKRLSCARAMLHLRDMLLEEDVKEALMVMRESLYRVG